MDKPSIFFPAQVWHVSAVRAGIRNDPATYGVQQEEDIQLVLFVLLVHRSILEKRFFGLAGGLVSSGGDERSSAMYGYGATLLAVGNVPQSVIVNRHFSVMPLSSISKSIGFKNGFSKFIFFALSTMLVNA